MSKLTTHIAVLIILPLLAVNAAYAQKIWRGVVYEEVSHEPIEGVEITTSEHQETLTDKQGRFTLTIKHFPVTVVMHYPGYPATRNFYYSGNELAYDIYLRDSSHSLDKVVVTASRRRQRIEETTQSMETLSSEQLTDLHAGQIQETANLLPGLSFQKDQLTIRGTSGFSYGTGSRVMVLMDDMPLISSDASDIKWNYLPVENLEQVEILKGASSALYGSSALEGTLQLRSAPADTPSTQVRQLLNVYDKPYRKNTSYFLRNNPIVYAMTMAHRQRIGNFRYSVSGNYYRDEGYRQSDNHNLIRGNLMVGYRPSDSSRFDFSVTLNGMEDKGETFLIFKGDSQPYRPFPNTNSSFNNRRWHSDQVVKYYSGLDGKHILRNRFYQTLNNNSTGQNSIGTMRFTEYQYQQPLIRRDSFRLILTAGAAYTYTTVASDNLYGNHKRDNPAAYVQFDQRISRLILSLGGRLEGYKLDSANSKWTTLPLLRGGLNFKAGEETFLRASLGQGYRYPSIAEYFGSAGIGVISIFPNKSLRPENGWNAELGVKQLFLFNGFKSYVDLSVFRSQYKDLIEYFFVKNPKAGVPLSQLFGFMALNTPNAQINGAELSSGLEKSFNRAKLSFLAGYTYVLPYNLDSMNSARLERNRYLDYRRRHLIKGNISFDYRALSFGVYGYYSSPFLNVDEFFFNHNADNALYPELAKDDRWASYSEAFITDVRLGLHLRKEATLSFMVFNIFNREYMEAPGNTNAPRTYSVQFNYQL